jgi:hypothetical protein
MDEPGKKPERSSVLHQRPGLQEDLSGAHVDLGAIRVLHSVWRRRIGEPKNLRSKAPVPLIPQLEAILERHREANGNPSSGPIFANGAGKVLDLDSLYRRQMKDPLKRSSDRAGRLARLPSRARHNSRTDRCQGCNWCNGSPPFEPSRYAQTLHQATHNRSDCCDTTLLGHVLGN